MENKIVSPNPHVHAKTSTASLMRDVIIALTPAMVLSVLYYGWSALMLLVRDAGDRVAFAALFVHFARMVGICEDRLNWQKCS